MIPYIVLVFKLIENFGVDLDGELMKIVKPHHEITASTLHKIELKKIDEDHWVSHAEDGCGGAIEENAKEENGVGTSVRVATAEMTIIPFIPHMDKGEPVS